MIKRIELNCYFCKKIFFTTIDSKTPEKIIYCNYCKKPLKTTSREFEDEEKKINQREKKLLQEIMEERKKNYKDTGILETNEERIFREVNENKKIEIENKYLFINNIKNKVNLYHFTDERNIPSIRKKGLYSWKALEENLNYKMNQDYFPCIDKRGISRNEDIRNGHENYIRLCKSKNIDQARARIDEGLKVIFLKLDLNLLIELECLFASDNATVKRRPVDINTDINTFINSQHVQAEVLVKHHIPKKYILD